MHAVIHSVVLSVLHGNKVYITVNVPGCFSKHDVYPLCQVYGNSCHHVDWGAPEAKIIIQLFHSTPESGIVHDVFGPTTIRPGRARGAVCSRKWEIHVLFPPERGASGKHFDDNRCIFRTFVISHRLDINVRYTGPNVTRIRLYESDVGDALRGTPFTATLLPPKRVTSVRGEPPGVTYRLARDCSPLYRDAVSEHHRRE
mmetsp:Transcript_27060/g.67646  ORF Transcript_27060/g.67646 Transcript_27060/m.67646 type:complete len:200 (-) Transcript_27060:3541-4140(-)